MEHCSTCLDIGLVDEIDDYPITFVRTVLCPRKCIQAIEAAPYVLDTDQEWRPVPVDDPIHSILSGQSKYIAFPVIFPWRGLNDCDTRKESVIDSDINKDYRVH